MKNYYVIGNKIPKLRRIATLICPRCDCIHNSLNAVKQCYKVIQNENTTFGKKAKIYEISVKKYND